MNGCGGPPRGPGADDADSHRDSGSTRKARSRGGPPWGTITGRSMVPLVVVVALVTAWTTSGGAVTGFPAVIPPVVLLLAATAAAVGVARRERSERATNSPSTGEVESLKERYVAGELSEADLERELAEALDGAASAGSGSEPGGRTDRASVGGGHGTDGRTTAVETTGDARSGERHCSR